MEKCKSDDQSCSPCLPIPLTWSIAAAVDHHSMAPCVCIDWRSGVDVEDGFDAYILKKCSATVLLVVDNRALEEEVACWCQEQGEEEE